MWGKKQREEKIEQLAEAVRVAEEAVARGGADAELVLAQLADALVSAPVNSSDISSFDPRLDDLNRRAWHLREQLENDVTDQRDRQVLPCARCGGNEILVCDAPAPGHLAVRSRAPTLPVQVSVCRACGDLRMTADAAEAIALRTREGDPVFRTVVVDSPDRGPYR